MKVVFSQLAFQKFRAYIHGISYEISGFGKIEKKDGDLVVQDVQIFEQVVSPAHTILDAKALAKFWDNLMVAGEDIGKWKLWWHSHVEMAAQFSGTDFDTIEEFDAEVPEENWMLSIVANKLGKMLCQIDIFEPIRCTIGNLGWDIEMGEPTQIDVSAEIAQKVHIQNFTPQQKRNTISWFEQRPLLPPMVENGRVLTYEERLQIFQETGNWPDVIEGSVVTDVH